jgi:hypothetical protein
MLDEQQPAYNNNTIDEGLPKIMLLGGKLLEQITKKHVTDD